MMTNTPTTDHTACRALYELRKIGLCCYLPCPAILVIVRVDDSKDDTMDPPAAAPPTDEIRPAKQQ